MANVLFFLALPALPLAAWRVADIAFTPQRNRGRNLLLGLLAFVLTQGVVVAALIGVDQLVTGDGFDRIDQQEVILLVGFQVGCAVLILPMWLISKLRFLDQ